MLFQNTAPAGVPSWWVEHIAVPVAFTLFGALLGFAAVRANVWWDSKTQTSNFLKGIASELRTLKQGLQQYKILADVASAEYANPIAKPDVVHFTQRLGMIFFTTQISRLPNISDERIFRIISLYNDIDAVQGFCDRLTSISFEIVHEAVDGASPKAENYFGGMAHLSQMIEKISIDLDNIMQQIKQ